MLYYDAWLPTLQQYTDLLYGTKPNPTVDAAVIGQLCGNTQALCTGANQQYDSLQDCVGSLSKKPYGSWDEVWGDNVLCRTLHVLLAKLRPDVSAVLLHRIRQSTKQITTDPLPTRRPDWWREVC